MDDMYKINVAKTELREAYNRGDVEQLLSVFSEENLTDMSEGGPSRYDLAAREGLREDAAEMFAEFSVRLADILFRTTNLGQTADADIRRQGILTPQKGGGGTQHQGRPSMSMLEN